MAATLSGALLHIKAMADLVPSSPHAGVINDTLENATGGRRWTNGTSSGNANTVYYRDRDALGAGATDSYNFLAAGALTDVFGATVDLDELKVLVVVCDSGQIAIEAPAANFLGIFSDATDLINMKASGGANCVAFDFGAAGLDVTANASIDIIEKSGATTADYRILAIGAS